MTSPTVDLLIISERLDSISMQVTQVRKQVGKVVQNIMDEEDRKKRREVDVVEIPLSVNKEPKAYDKEKGIYEEKDEMEKKSAAKQAQSSDGKEKKKSEKEREQVGQDKKEIRTGEEVETRKGSTKPDAKEHVENGDTSEVVASSKEKVDEEQDKCLEESPKKKSSNPQSDEPLDKLLNINKPDSSTEGDAAKELRKVVGSGDITIHYPDGRTVHKATKTVPENEAVKSVPGPDLLPNP